MLTSRWRNSAKTPVNSTLTANRSCNSLSTLAKLGIVLGLIVILWIVGMLSVLSKNREHWHDKHASEDLHSQHKHFEQFNNGKEEVPDPNHNFEQIQDTDKPPLRTQAPQPKDTQAPSEQEQNPSTKPPHSVATSTATYPRKYPVVVVPPDLLPIQTQKPAEPTESTPSMLIDSTGVNKPTKFHPDLPNPAVVILTYNRPDYLEQTLESLKALPEIEYFTLYVSQDGFEPNLIHLVDEYNIELIHRKRIPLMSPDQSGTAFLAQHYKFVFDMLLLQRNHTHLVLIEDDMIFSPDFLRLFLETATFLNNDPTVFCVSSWHDLGRFDLTYDHNRLFRTQYFPGLGWMIARPMWLEIQKLFPLDQWDHFMRLDTIHKHRDCIVPEISRNRNIGVTGTNTGNNFHSKFLAPIAFHTEDNVKFGDLSYLKIENYENYLEELVHNAKHFGSFSTELIHEILSLPSTTNSTEPNLLITYRKDEWHQIGPMFKTLSVPRSSHNGLIILRKGIRFLLFADIKSCPYLPENLKWKQEPFKIMIATEEETCVSACSRDGLVCNNDYFQFVNECSVLLKLFPCERGCRGGVDGNDVPNYVTTPKKPDLVHQCLTTEGISECTASHWSAKRVCPCLPVKTP